MILGELCGKVSQDSVKPTSHITLFEGVIHEVCDHTKESFQSFFFAAIRGVKVCIKNLNAKPIININ